MNIRPPFIAHFQAPIAWEPGQRALDDPAMPTQALACVNTPARDPGLNVSGPQPGARQSREPYALSACSLAGRRRGRPRRRRIGGTASMTATTIRISLTMAAALGFVGRS